MMQHTAGSLDQKQVQVPQALFTLNYYRCILRARINCNSLKLFTANNGFNILCSSKCTENVRMTLALVENGLCVNYTWKLFLSYLGTQNGNPASAQRVNYFS